MGIQPMVGAYVPIVKRLCCQATIKYTFRAHICLLNRNVKAIIWMPCDLRHNPGKTILVNKLASKLASQMASSKISEN